MVDGVPFGTTDPSGSTLLSLFEGVDKLQLVRGPDWGTMLKVGAYQC